MLGEVALAARELGHDYLAICDHTPQVRVVPGLAAEDLRRQGEEISAVNEHVAPFQVTCAESSATSVRTARWTRTTTSLPSSTGCRSACTRASAARAPS